MVIFCGAFRPQFVILVKRFSKTNVNPKETLAHGKKFKPSSQKWLTRQINDNYVKLAKKENYRCRSAFKLLEINKSYKIFKVEQTVVDLGCAPGSWTQVAVNATKANIPKSGSVVVGVDLSPVHPVEGATLLSSVDFTQEQARHRLTELLAGRGVDVVLSDMAPAASGIKSMDHFNIVKLCYAALAFAEQTSSQGGTLVMKAFDGSECKQLSADARRLYETVRIVRPAASRKESSEIFFVCLKFKGKQPKTEANLVRPITREDNGNNNQTTRLETR